MKYAAALVDFDGTLVDSMPSWMDLPFVSLRKAGYDVTDELRFELRWAPMSEVSGWLGERYPRLLEQGPLWEQWLRMMEENYLTRIAVKPGATELLTLLREAGLKIYILSATRQPLLGKAVAHFGMDRMTDGIFSEAEAGSKHSSAPYEFFAARLGVEPSRLLMVEDASRNLAAARERGLGCVGVYDEIMSPELPALKAAADVYLPDYRDLRPLKDFLEKA